MKKCSFVLVNILICAFAVMFVDAKPCLSQCNQDSTTTDSTASRLQIIERYLVSSYATALGGLNFPGGHGKWDDIWVEADINQHWHFQPCFFKDRFFFKINPRVRLRLFNENSTPVKTPSFMPNITLFFGFGKTTDLTTGFTYYSIMLSHHSNGQANFTIQILTQLIYKPVVSPPISLILASTESGAKIRCCKRGRDLV